VLKFTMCFLTAISLPARIISIAALRRQRFGKAP
jgi:hypothetical protein